MEDKINKQEDMSFAAMCAQDESVLKGQKNGVVLTCIILQEIQRGKTFYFKVNCGLKSEGIVNKSEFSDSMPRIGDTIDLVLADNNTSEPKLSYRMLKQQKVIEELRQICNEKKKVSLEVIEKGVNQCKVRYKNVDGHIYSKNITETTVEAYITKVTFSGKFIAAFERMRLPFLKYGDKVRGTVKAITDHFLILVLDNNKFEGILDISENKDFKIGDQLLVMVTYVVGTKVFCSIQKIVEENFKESLQKIFDAKNAIVDAEILEVNPTNIVLEVRCKLGVNTKVNIHISNIFWSPDALKDKKVDISTYHVGQKIRMLVKDAFLIYQTSEEKQLRFDVKENPNVSFEASMQCRIKQLTSSNIHVLANSHDAVARDSKKYNFVEDENTNMELTSIFIIGSIKELTPNPYLSFVKKQNPRVKGIVTAKYLDTILLDVNGYTCVLKKSKIDDSAKECEAKFNAVQNGDVIECKIFSINGEFINLTMRESQFIKQKYVALKEVVRIKIIDTEKTYTDRQEGLTVELCEKVINGKALQGFLPKREYSLDHGYRSWTMGEEASAQVVAFKNNVIILSVKAVERKDVKDTIKSVGDTTDYMGDLF